MKKSNFILFLLFILISACGNKEKNEPLIKAMLYQTQWKGKLKFIENEKVWDCSITIAFETDSRGNYISEDLNEESNYFPDMYFNYHINDKIVKIGERGANNLLFGNWWITNFTKKHSFSKEIPIQNMNLY